jgi:YtcA family
MRGARRTLPIPAQIRQASSGKALSAAAASNVRRVSLPTGCARCYAGLLPCMLLTGCAGAPSVGILGAYFPDWLFCAIGGAVLTAVVRLLCWRGGYGSWLTPPAIVYPALTVLFAMVLWVVVFNL